MKRWIIRFVHSSEMIFADFNFELKQSNRLLDDISEGINEAALLL